MSVVGQLKKYIEISKCLAFSSIWLVFSCTRGTEVGNGNRPSERVDPQDQTIGTGAADESNSAFSPWLDWLLAPCGSPLREIGSQILAIPDSDDRLKIEKNAEIRDLNYLEQRWQIEPVVPGDVSDFRIRLRQLDTSSTIDTAHAHSYQCGAVSSSSDQTLRQMEITMDQQTAEMSWYRQAESGVITRIEIVWDTGLIELVGFIADDQDQP